MRTYQELLRDGDALLHQARYGEAVQAFGRAVELDPERKEALARLGVIFKDLGDLEGAVGCLVKAASLDDRDAFVWLNLGLALYEQGRMVEAAHVLRNVATLIDAGLAEVNALLAEREHEPSAALREQHLALEETANDVRALLDAISERV